MSLLMEALRKAEEAKRGAADRKELDSTALSTDSPAPADTAPEHEQNRLTADGTGTAPGTASDGQATITPRQPELAAEQKPSAAEHAHNGRDSLHRNQNQQAANNLFLAKQAARRRQQQRRRLIMLLGGLLLLPLAGGSFYLWYTLTASSSSIASSSDTSVPPRFLSDRTTVAADSARPLSDTDSPSSAVRADNAADTDTPEAGVGNGGDEPITTDQAENSNRAASTGATAGETQTESQPEPPGTESAQPATMIQSPAEDNAEQPLQLSSRETTLVVTPELSAAYEHFLAGRLSSAREAYLTVLENNPENRDAILGLAAIERRRGDSAAAQRLYARLLSLNPRDPMARTGLIETARSADPLQRESDLRQLEEDHPRLAAISFALGNLHAGQQRWRQAQNAYFNALRKARQGDGAVSPDYAFNLAISLEQLGETDLALDYYREAEQQADQVAPGFDRRILQRRIQVLEAAHEQ